MVCEWLKISPSLNKGITVVNQLEESKFEQFLRHILAKMKVQDTEIFTEDEKQKLVRRFQVTEEDLLLAVRTIIYLCKRMLKFIFMPSDLNEDLIKIGLSNEKSDCIVKVWSVETKTTLNEMGSNIIDEQSDNLHFDWRLNAELSSGFQKKSKTPKTYLTMSGQQTESVLELTHSELYSVFHQFESIQNALDILL